VGENGPTGALRLLDTQLGSQIGWLLPLAVIGFLAAAWQTRRRVWPLTRQQSALVLWGMWLLTMDIFFDIAGFYHTYYLVMIAPAIAALSGIGIVSLWQLVRQRDTKLWPLLPLSLLAVAAVEAHILSDYPAWSSWLTPLTLALAALSALALVFLRLRRNLSVGLLIPSLLLGLAGLLAAPAVWSLETVMAADAGVTPRAGPAGTASGGPGGFAFGRRGSFQPPVGSFGPPPGAFGNPPGSSGLFQPPNGAFRPGNRFGPGGDQVNKGLLKYLKQHQGGATYLFATPNAGTAEAYIIATGKAVMTTGGFTGSDPILTPTKLAALVKQGKVRYFLLSGGPGGGPGGDNNSLAAWVQANGRAVPASAYSSIASSAAGFDGGTLYDLGAVK
jgi:4-amino-4-deoxy-L-arabinose transferase-like glycosyltransferase